jgi:predicted DNA-binding transcriptional regulator AlpA
MEKIVDKLIKKPELLEYICIGETKIDEIIRDGKFVKPIFIDGFAHALYSVNEVQEWIKLQRQKRDENVDMSKLVKKQQK